MTKNGIWIVSDKKEAKLLRKKMADFDFPKYSKAEIAELIKKMRTAMKKAEGVGLSANQIGLNLKVFVAQVGDKFYAIFNPRITKSSEELAEMEEGCLSVPGVFGTVVRPSKIVLEGFDKSGKLIKIKTWGMLARVFQHEIDHLNGCLFTDLAANLHEYEEIKK